ncbi:MAG: hypothetical protein ACYC3I_02555 [Gemmataceae bacterium]
MNLFLALFWLICAVMLLIYEQSVGPAQYRIRVFQYDFSWIWLMLLLVVYNLKRWWWIRAYRAKQRALASARVNEKWERRRHSTDPARTPDPNINFTDEPPDPSDGGVSERLPPPN